MKKYNFFILVETTMLPDQKLNTLRKMIDQRNNAK